VTLGTLVILGSGETAPNMVKVHREVLSRLDRVRGVLLDTPFGFQENVPQLTEKILDYFATSLQVSLTPATFVRSDATSELQRAQYLDAVRSANFVFAGPGSPSYAVKQWASLDFTDALETVLNNNGVVTFASAAALTLGAYTAPIYEIYKVGESPYWLSGLDLLSRLGLRCVVIPHYDNAEGQNHDTRCCYLGERRLRMMEDMLDPDVATLGVDEHTAVIIDLAAQTLHVRGRGNAYWRSGDSVRTLSAEDVVPLSELQSAPVPARAPLARSVVTELSDIDVLATTALAGGPDAALAVAQLTRRAATGGEGRIDPAPLVEGVLRARALAREAKQFELADQLRQALVDGGIEVQDTPSGASWRVPSETDA